MVVFRPGWRTVNVPFTQLSTGVFTHLCAVCLGISEGCLHQTGKSEYLKNVLRKWNEIIWNNTHSLWIHLLSLWAPKGSGCPHLIPSKGQSRCLALCLCSRSGGPGFYRQQSDTWRNHEKPSATDHQITAWTSLFYKCSPVSISLKTAPEIN